MPAHRKTSVPQILVLLEYFEKNRLANAAGKTEMRHWNVITKMLNKLPGAPKDPLKWRNYWNELKATSRKKSNLGRPLLPYEKRVLNLVGTLDPYPRPVQPDNILRKLQLKDQDHSNSEPNHSNFEQKQNNSEQDDNNSEQGQNNSEQDHNNSEQNRNNSEQDDNNSEQEDNNSEQEDNNSDQDHNTSEQEDSTEMEFENATVPEQDQDESIPDPMATLDISVQNYQSDQDERPEEVDLKENIDLPNAEVPEWVHKVEQSRLQLEERTTAAIEQMVVGITSIAESLRGVVASLRNIEESIQSLKRKD